METSNRQIMYPLVSSSKIMKHGSNGIRVLYSFITFDPFFQSPEMSSCSFHFPYLSIEKTWDFPIASSNREDGLKHPWIVTAAAPDPETGREKTIEVEEEMEAE